MNHKLQASFLSMTSFCIIQLGTISKYLYSKLSYNFRYRQLKVLSEFNEISFINCIAFPFYIFKCHFPSLYYMLLTIEVKNLSQSFLLSLQKTFFLVFNLSFIPFLIDIVIFPNIKTILNSINLILQLFKLLFQIFRILGNHLVAIYFN